MQAPSLEVDFRGATARSASVRIRNLFALEADPNGQAGRKQGPRASWLG